MQWLKVPAWKVEDRELGLEPRSGIQVSKKQKNPSRSLVKIKYWGEPPCLRGSVLGLIPPGLDFRIMCLEVSVILFVSPSSEEEEEEEEEKEEKEEEGEYLFISPQNTQYKWFINKMNTTG